MRGRFFWTCMAIAAAVLVTAGVLFGRVGVGLAMLALLVVLVGGSLVLAFRSSGQP